MVAATLAEMNEPKIQGIRVSFGEFQAKTITLVQKAKAANNGSTYYINGVYECMDI